MAEFATVTNGFMPHEHMSEIIDAVNERRLAAIHGGMFIYDAPDPIPATGVYSFQGGSVKPTHRLIQEMLEAIAPYFIDHDQYEDEGYDDTNENQPIPKFTLERWREVAGIDNGFRRATTWNNPAADPSFSHGLIETGDIAGYWIWEDIVEGIKALQWTSVPLIFGISGAGMISSDQTSPPPLWDTVNAAKSYGNTAYNNSWRTGWYLYRNRRAHIRVEWTTRWDPNIGDYVDAYIADFMCSKEKFRRFNTVGGANLPASVVFLARPQQPGSSYVYFDLEGKAKDEWFEVETVEVEQGDSGDMTDYTLVAPTSTPFNVVSSDGILYGSNSTIHVIDKWKFSRT